MNKTKFWLSLPHSNYTECLLKQEQSIKTGKNVYLTTLQTTWFCNKITQKNLQYLKNNINLAKSLSNAIKNICLSIF